MRNKTKKLTQLSDLMVEASVDLEKAKTMCNELSIFFDKDAINSILPEFDIRKMETYILFDYLDKIYDTVEQVIQITEEIYGNEKSGAEANEEV